MITNKTNGKSYIGYTTRTLNQRWKSHLTSMRQGSKFRFHCAIRKYGVDNWVLQILYENENIEICKEKEEEMIALYETFVKGYNATFGGTGGWVVPEEKYESWKQKISEKNTGSNNSNSINITNEELIKIGSEICLNLGRVVGHSTIVKEFEKRNLKFPKTFTKYRFQGDYKNYVKILMKLTGLDFCPHFRSEDFKTRLSNLNKGKESPNRNSKVIITEEGKRKHVKN
jgi:group I intron endonuclease